MLDSPAKIVYLVDADEKSPDANVDKTALESEQAGKGIRILKKFICSQEKIPH